MMIALPRDLLSIRPAMTKPQETQVIIRVLNVAVALPMMTLAIKEREQPPELSRLRSG